MSDSMLIAGFLFIVFAPCAAAFFASGLASSSDSGEVYMDKLPRHRGEAGSPLRAMLAEVPLSEEFEIRSFPKGISQRRILVRDTKSGVRLTIAQVRAAAVELFKLGGVAAAYEFALLAAASAAAMGSIRNAFAIAARQTLDAARNAYEWFAWSEAMTRDGTVGELMEEAWPSLAPVSVDMLPWQADSQAA